MTTKKEFDEVFDEKLAEAQANWQYDPTLTIRENLDAMYRVLDAIWPPPDRPDQIPSARAVSGNVCPNSRPRSPMDPSTCVWSALTTWGYCEECWNEGRVPSEWVKRVGDEIERLAP